jgi:hypothetical protein
MAAAYGLPGPGDGGVGDTRRDQSGAGVYLSSMLAK